MPSNPNSDNWGEWRQHVLLELERLNGCYERLDGRLGKLNEDMVALKIKSGIWGFAAGSVPALAIILYKVIGLK